MSKAAVIDADEESEVKKAVKKAANASWKPPVEPEGGQKMVKLTVHKPESDNGTDCYVSVNFKSYLIKYGEAVTVPQEVADAMKATVIETEVYDPKTEKMKTVRHARFAVSVEAV